MWWRILYAVVVKAISDFIEEARPSWISLEYLLANPELFDDKKIKVRGYYQDHKLKSSKEGGKGLMLVGIGHYLPEDNTKIWVKGVWTLSSEDGYFLRVISWDLSS